MFQDVCKTCLECLLDALFGHLVSHMSSRLAHIGPKELQKASILELFFRTFFGLVLSWMLDRAEKVPKGSQKAILASFGEHSGIFFGYISDSWDASRPLQNHFPMDVWMLCCTTSKHIKNQTNWAKSMHKNFKGPSKSPEHPKCRNTSRCGGVASASLNNMIIRYQWQTTKCLIM